MNSIHLSCFVVTLALSCLITFAQEPQAMTVAIGAVQQRPTEFFGVGFHAFFPMHAKFVTPEIEKKLHRRWHDLNPSFARVTHQWDWNEPFAARQMRMMKATGTKIYLTTWNPEDLHDPATIDAYGEKVAAMLGGLTEDRGLDAIRWYCMTNELSMPGQWAALYQDMPRFESYHRAIHKAIAARKLNVGLLASDASPVKYWKTIAWAAEHMNEVTEAYGGHHYLGGHAPDDLELYPWFRDQVRPVAETAHTLGKPFIIGEFGPKQHRGERYGFARWDGCAYFDTPLEPMAALQTVEAAMAAINGGTDAIAYWTFADFPDDYVADKAYANKWGTVRWDGDFSTRPVYYAIGLMTRFFRGPADVCDSQGPERVRCLAIRERDRGAYRVAVINRRSEAIAVDLSGQYLGGDWEAYVFNPAEAETYCRSETLLSESNRIQAGGEPKAVIPAQSLVVFVQK